MKQQLFILFSLFFHCLFGQDGIIPKRANDTIVHHVAYSVSYNSLHRQANWISYLLTKAELNGPEERASRFTADPKIPNTDNEVDYKKSGFDRGHLAPAADMTFDEKAMKESFYFSNCSPQTPSFNRGIWKKLEEEVRDLARLHDSVYVLTGPVLGDSLCKIGPHFISVPDYYYKILLIPIDGNLQGIAFIFPNENSKVDLLDFSCSIDYIETFVQLEIQEMISRPIVDYNRHFWQTKFE